jgi:hypothetical protein
MGSPFPQVPQRFLPRTDPMTYSGFAAHIYLYRSIVTFTLAMFFLAPARVAPANLPPRDQRQVAAHNEDGERYGHQKSTHPEAPVAVHPMPVGTWVRLTVVAAMSFVEVPVSCHIASGSIVAFGNAVICGSSLCTVATL